MSEMVDRAAAAMHSKLQIAPELLRVLARAAIAAMREPTANMIDAGRQAVWEQETREQGSGARDWPAENAVAGYQAMIDEALR